LCREVVKCAVSTYNATLLQVDRNVTHITLLLDAHMQYTYLGGEMGNPENKKPRE